MSGVHAGPLPGVNRPSSSGPLLGWWRGFVEQISPLMVSVPSFAGSGQGIGKVEIVQGLNVVVGDRVWVVAIEGNRRDLLIVALR